MFFVPRNSESDLDHRDALTQFVKDMHEVACCHTAFAVSSYGAKCSNVTFCVFGISDSNGSGNQLASPRRWGLAIGHFWLKSDGIFDIVAPSACLTNTGFGDGVHRVVHSENSAT
jgi:hypothetical protein